MWAPARSVRSADCLTAGVLFAAILYAHPSPAGQLAASDRQRLVDSGRVDAEVVDALDSRGKAAVLIGFKLPHSLALAGSAGSDKRATTAAIESERRRILSRFSAPELDRGRGYRSVSLIAGHVSAAGCLKLLDDSAVESVNLDLPVYPALTESVPLMNLPALHALGFTGDGVTVAVVDSGIDTDHPDLQDSLVAEMCFCSSNGYTPHCCPNGSNFQDGPGAAEDDQGHGTHVAGIVTSNGIVAAPGGAPDAQIVAVRVIGTESGMISDLLSGLDWILDERPDVDVINMSLATSTLFNRACDDVYSLTRSFATIVNALHARGVVVVAAAGNDASDIGMGLPACLSNVLSVGAVYDADLGPQTYTVCVEPNAAVGQLACFTNTAATLDVVAPGSAITSTYLGGSAATMSGTSMASPAAVSCVAVLREAHPDWTPQQIELAMKSSPVRVTDASSGRTYARVDCAAALNFSCGDSVADPGEECDDGNLTDCDGCSGTCRVESGLTCGDGVLNDACGERCDDGNLADGDGCSATCLLQSPKRDHFLCYRAGNSRDVPAFTPVDTGLLDFQADGTYGVTRRRGVCIPVAPDGETRLDPATYLTWYGIKEKAVSQLYDRLQSNSITRFGETFVDTVKPDRLLVPAARSLTGPVDPPLESSHVLDRYKCYKTRLQWGFAPDEGVWQRGQTVTLRDPLTDEPVTYELVRPTVLCNPAGKDGAPIRFQYDRMQCYRVRPTANRAHMQRGIHTSDELGPGLLDLRREGELCMTPERGCTSFLAFWDSPRPQAGCGGCPCEECVCAIKPLCCYDIWDQVCVEMCQQICQQQCR